MIGFNFHSMASMTWMNFFLYRLNGPDPLDYITMFANPGSPHEGVPAHWHYVSCGLSDLHGDSRVHKYEIILYFCCHL